MDEIFEKLKRKDYRHITHTSIFIISLSFLYDLLSFKVIFSCRVMAPIFWQALVSYWTVTKHHGFIPLIHQENVKFVLILTEVFLRSFVFWTPSTYDSVQHSDNNLTGRLRQATVCLWTVLNSRKMLFCCYSCWCLTAMTTAASWLAGYEAICQHSWQLRLEILQ